MSYNPQSSPNAAPSVALHAPRDDALNEKEHKERNDATQLF